MMEIQNKMHSISFQFVLLLICALGISGIFFGVGHSLISYIIDAHIYTEEYEMKRDKKYLQSLQTYIDANGISMKQCKELGKWIKKQQILSISVYQDNKKIYDADYPNHDFFLDDIEEEEYEWVTYYQIRFTDGIARIGISGRYEYQLYQYAIFLEVLASFILFVGIMLEGIRKKIEYIKILHCEIGILENGGLEYEITVRGNDELTVMANGLNKMRLSFINMIERETEIIEENQKTITEMSHDLRTPVTSMLLFLEVIKKDEYKSMDLVKEYAGKLEQKVLYMKQLTDHLFKYTLVTRGEDTDLQIMSFQECFYDALSEMCVFIENNGFSVHMQVDWNSMLIRISMEYMVRMLDNIASNILKYADHVQPVEISSVYDGEMVGLIIQNAVRNGLEKVDSYGIGLKSIENMMNKLGGKFRHSLNNGKFCVELFFVSSSRIHIYQD